ncbi:hypothetical protein IAT40_004279 [Kwoniella sp. CBS 6097]
MEQFRKLKQRIAFPSRHRAKVSTSAADEPPLDPMKGIKLPPLKPSVQEFAHLEPVHRLIMDHLFHLTPKKVVSLSRWHYDHYIPVLYRHVTLNSSSFAGLFRSYGRGEPWDNRTIRAYRNHTKTLRIFDIWSAYNLCTLTYGDQPVYVPHKDLLTNVTKIELSWEVLMLQVQAQIHALHSNIAGQLGQHLREGMVEEIVIKMKGELDRTGLRKALEDFERECKPKTITCLYGPTWGLSENFEVYAPDPYTSRIPTLRSDCQYVQTLRIVFASRLGRGWDDRPILQDLRSHIRTSAIAHSSINMEGNMRPVPKAPHKPKIEYHIPRAASTRARLVQMFTEEGKGEIVVWMDRNTEFFEVDGRTLWIGWSDLWQEARGRKVIKVSKE